MNIRWILNRAKIMNKNEVIYRMKVYKYEKNLFKNYVENYTFKEINYFKVNIVDLQESKKKRIDEIAKYINNGNYEIFGYKINIDSPNLFFFDPINNGEWEALEYNKITLNNELGDPKVILEINKQQYLLDLALGYHINKNNIYAEKILKHIEKWILSCGSFIGPGWKSGLEIGLRCITWMYSLSMIEDYIKEKGINLDIIVSELIRQVEFIYNRLSLYSSANNHLIGELTTILHASFFIECSYSEKWRKKSIKLLNEQIKNQFFEDGINKEQSINYQLHTMELYFLSQNLLINNNMSLNNNVLKILKQSCYYISCISERNGECFNIGDEDGGEILKFLIEENSILSLLECSRRLLENIKIDSKDNIFTIKPELFYNKIRFEKNMTVDINRENSIFPLGGMFIRNKKIYNDKYKLTFDFGKSGLEPLYAHAHSDIFSVNLSVNGKGILIDGGTYKYHNSNGFRDYFRSVKSHNSISINDKNQFKFLGKFMSSKSPESKIVSLDDNNICCYSDAYKNIRCKIYRKISFNENIIIIEDKIENNSIKDVEIKQYFNFDSNIKIELTNNYLILNNYSIKFQFNSIKDINIFYGDNLLRGGWQSKRYYNICKTNTVITTSMLKRKSSVTLVTKIIIDERNSI